MDFDILSAYIIAVVVIVSIPGPNIILIINDSLHHGLKKSLLTILGIKAGTSLLFALSLSGLAAVLLLFSSLFTLIKWAGVCYLIYLGVSQILVSFRPANPEVTSNMADNHFFLKGFFVSSTNPKGLLFAGAFFPQFVSTDAAVFLQVLFLCALFMVISFFIEILYAYAGTRTGKLFKTERIKNAIDRISGSLLVMFGVGLAFVRKTE